MSMGDFLPNLRWILIWMFLKYSVILMTRGCLRFPGCFSRTTFSVKRFSLVMFGMEESYLSFLTLSSDVHLCMMLQRKSRSYFCL